MSSKNRRLSRFHGLLIVDKPDGLTSQDVVDRIRRSAETRRVGHSGTLDPMATGLLIVLVGEATKLSEYLVGFDKEYHGTMQLGVYSDTYDSMGEIQDGDTSKLPDLEALREAAAALTGEISQTPPPYSAVKVKGKKLYEYAREGRPVDATPRPVHVHSFEILELKDNEARFRVACSSGTYVRSLVHEAGQRLGCGALVKSLRRISVGDFHIDEALKLDQIEAAAGEGFASCVLPMVDALTHWPIYYVNPEGLEWLLRGQAIPSTLAQLDGESEPGTHGDKVFLCPLGGDAAAVGQIVPAPPGPPPAALKVPCHFWFQPIKVLAPSQQN